MAEEADTIDVKFTKQRVYHDGTSMIVAKPDDTKPLARGKVQTFIDEGSIEEPEGWGDDLAYKNSLAVADGGATFTANGPIGDVDIDDQVDTFDHDGDGNPGGSEPHDPPALSGKNKAQLLEIAADEEVAIEEGATNAQIVEAIEAARAASAGDDDADDAPAA